MTNGLLWQLPFLACGLSFSYHGIWEGELHLYLFSRALAMLSLCVAQSRTRLCRVATSILRTQTKNFCSTKSSSSNVMVYIAMAGVASIPGLWWMTATRDDVPHLGSAPVEHLVLEPGPYKDQVTHILSQETYSFPV
jgi:hypothetical protein